MNKVKTVMIEGFGQEKYSELLNEVNNVLASIQAKEMSKHNAKGLPYPSQKKVQIDVDRHSGMLIFASNIINPQQNIEMEAQTCCESYVNLPNSQEQAPISKNTKTGNAEIISSSNENEVLIIDKNSLQA